MLEVFSDLYERLNYNLPDFPLYVRMGELRHFERYTAACHWHPDLEFILILDGSMEYFVNGKTLNINKGEGIFVNSNRLHYGFSSNNSDCMFIVIAINPVILSGNTSPGKTYVESKFGFNTEDFIVLTDNTDWQKNLLMSIRWVYDEIQVDENNPIHLLSLAASLCARVADHIQPFSSLQADKYSWMAIWKMTGFIHQNYEKKITLGDIGAAGSVCRSRCCRLFNEHIGQTPNLYLTRYRIYKSTEMLRESAMPISEVSMACGFQSPSYFTQIFHKEIGLAPRDYRNQFN